MSSLDVSEEALAQFLLNNPGFFERQAQLLSTVTLRSPHSQRAIGLQERQAELLREKIKDLEEKGVKVFQVFWEYCLLFAEGAARFQPSG